MAEDLGDKTEAPTPRKLEQAREKGQVAKSTDLVAAIDLITAALLLWFFGSVIVRTGRDLMEAGLRMQGDGAGASLFDARAAGTALARSLLTMAPVAVTAILALLLASVIAHVQQTRLVLSTEPLVPNIERLNPIAGIGRMFGRKNLVRSGMSIAKLFFALALVGVVTAAKAEQFAALPNLGFAASLAMMVRLVMEIIAWLLAVLLVLGVADYLFQRWQQLQELKMTKQQVKDERKETDGDPEIKSRIRRIGRQIAMGQLKRDVPTADVIVTNPTHYAIALKYDANSMSAPRVVAKGVDFMAFRIRELAIAASIPVVEKPELARALYKHAQVGKPIDARFFQAVAEVLAYVYRLQGKAA
ncbi:MAG TPA: flagellar biosynthesis protein FlhB [Phycisphaerales bacterium]|nr:flagellar biosynthesis protein FlhB [Phycisphaerales bacterium]